MNSVWQDSLTEADRKVIEEWGEKGLKHSRDLGDNPAVVVVDVQHSMAGSKIPVEEACKESRLACGNNAWEAVEEIQHLLATARDSDVPIYYFKAKGESEGAQILDEVEPQPDDTVIEKTSSSGFFSTSFTTILQNDGIDTLIITGGSTCGCVRATVDDAYARGYGVIVPHTCVFDRIELSHKASLLDISMKRGNVLSLDETEEFISENKP